MQLVIRPNAPRQLYRVLICGALLTALSLGLTVFFGQQAADVFRASPITTAFWSCFALTPLLLLVPAVALAMLWARRVRLALPLLCTIAFWLGLTAFWGAVAAFGAPTDWAGWAMLGGLILSFASFALATVAFVLAVIKTAK